MAAFFDRFLKKNAAKGERHLQLSEIPGYLDSKEADINAKVESAAIAARSAASAGMREIGDKIRGLEEAGADDIRHPSPKVKQTALKSKKNFIISIEKTLSTELPEDPDLLYPALIELIRSVANNMRRQGKYLHPAFPDEMKEIKSSLDIIGRALNTMTEDFKPSVELREKINRARGYYEKVSGAAIEIRDIEAEAGDFDKKTESLKRSMADLESERKEIMSSGDFLEYESLAKELESLKEEKGEISARYGSLLVACDNVLRKTAYIAEKNGDAEVSENMNYLVVLLHSGESRDSAEASGIYRELYPYIHKTVSENDTLIKNKHEEQLFSSVDLFVSQLDEICSSYSGTLFGIDSAKERLSALGVDERIARLDEKVSDIEAETEKINREMSSGLSRKESLEESVPVMIEDLTVLLSEIEGGDVAVEGDWKETFLRE